MNWIRMSLPYNLRLLKHKNQANINTPRTIFQPLVGERRIRCFYCIHLLGVTLILGFVFMLIVDNFSSRLFHHHGGQGLLDTKFSKKYFSLFYWSVIDSSGSVFMQQRMVLLCVYYSSKHRWMHRIDLLGAASATSRFQTELIVFMAIMLHKVIPIFRKKKLRSVW